MAVGRALEGRIMEDHRLTATADSQVVLQPVEAQVEGAAEAREGVLGSLHRGPPMTQDPGRSGDELSVGIGVA